MPRKARKNLCTSFFHVIVQGVNKEFIFYKEKYRKKYLDILEEAKEKYNLDIIAYAIMYNHAHLLIHTENINMLAKFMKKVNEDYGRYYNFIKERKGHIFRDRYLSEEITSQRYLLNCIVYIHNNPIKSGVATKCENYKYSSYKDYLGMKGFVDKNIIKLILGTDKLDVEVFRQLHKKNKYYFAEYDDELKQNMEEIIEEFEIRYNMKIEKIVQNPFILKDVLVEIRDRIHISDRKLSEFLKINRNKISKMLK